MYPAWGLEVLGLVGLVWLLILTRLVLKERSFLHKLFPDRNDQAEGHLLLRKKFQEVLDSIEEFRQREVVANRNFRQLSKEGLRNLQKIEISRYNPYGDTGGDQSFSIVMLDGKNTGFILTSLHSRSGTRIYAKTIDKATSEIELSKEEKAVLKKAIDEK